MLKPAVLPSLWGYAGVLVAITTVSTLQVIDPVIYGRMVDVIVSALQIGDTSTLVRDVGFLLIIWVGIFAINTVLGILGRYAFWFLNNRVSRAFTSRVMRDMLGWSRQRFGNTSSGRMLKIFDDAWDGLFSILGEIFQNLLPTFISFVVVVIVGAVIDWRLTLISLAFLPISIVVGVYAWRRAKPKQHEIGTEWANISRNVGESISNMAAIQNFAQEPRREQTFAAMLKQVITKQLKMNVFWAIFHGSSDALGMLARIGVFLLGITLVANGSLTLGVLITFLGMLNFLLTPIQFAIANSLPRISRIMTSFQLLVELYEQTNDVVEAADAKKFSFKAGDVELENVSFEYIDGTRSTLKNVSLKIPAGASCALVGPSGAGKSTLVKLINRTIDPSKGVMRIDGQDLKDFTLRSIRSRIGVVSQETLLFDDTLLNNVKFVRPGATKKEVIEACKKAEAHGFISKLPKGYNSIVGERGVKLSGGERQRIAIARIFLADTPILVLDESTSALDSETEHKLQETLKKVMKGRTTILIAHRLSTIYLADQIVVMEEGKIVDRGTHTELMKKGGLYNRLWKLQSGGYLK